MLIAGLSAGNKTGIAIMAAAFVLFAIAASFVLPRFFPDFPGPRRVRLFVLVSALFAAGMLTAIATLAKEPKEASATQPTSTSTGPTSTTATPPAGNAAAGKALFTSASIGCSSCHTFKPAGATGKIGPDLDHLAADAKKANRGTVAQYAHESIQNPKAYVVPGFQPLMPDFGATLKPQQIDDLVAFLLSK